MQLVVRVSPWFHFIKIFLLLKRSPSTLSRRSVARSLLPGNLFPVPSGKPHCDFYPLSFSCGEEALSSARSQKSVPVWFGNLWSTTPETPGYSQKFVSRTPKNCRVFSTETCTGLLLGNLLPWKLTAGTPYMAKLSVWAPPDIYCGYPSTYCSYSRRAIEDALKIQWGRLGEYFASTLGNSSPVLLGNPLRAPPEDLRVLPDSRCQCSGKPMCAFRKTLCSRNPATRILGNLKRIIILALEVCKWTCTRWKMFYSLHK